MGWRQLRGWLREMRREKEAAQGRSTTDPGSWDGVENDSWWAEQAEKRDRERGRR